MCVRRTGRSLRGQPMAGRLPRWRVALRSIWGIPRRDPSESMCWFRASPSPGGRRDRLTAERAADPPATQASTLNGEPMHTKSAEFPGGIDLQN